MTCASITCSAIGTSCSSCSRLCAVTMMRSSVFASAGGAGSGADCACGTGSGGGCEDRSEEHTSELQSLMRISYAVFCLKQNKHQSFVQINPMSHLTEHPVQARRGLLLYIDTR